MLHQVDHTIARHTVFFWSYTQLGVAGMSWQIVRYVCATALAVGSIFGFRIVLIYLGIVDSPIGIGPHLPFATVR